MTQKSESCMDTYHKIDIVVADDLVHTYHQVSCSHNVDLC